MKRYILKGPVDSEYLNMSNTNFETLFTRSKDTDDKVEAFLKPNAIKTENIADGQITPEKTTFFEIVSDNLLDRERYIKLSSIDPVTGKLRDNRYHKVTGFVEVEPGIDYTIYSYTGVVLLAHYDEDYNLIKTESNPIHGEGFYTFKTPTNGARIRMQLVTNPKDDMRVNKGSSASPPDDFELGFKYGGGGSVANQGPLITKTANMGGKLESKEEDYLHRDYEINIQSLVLTFPIDNIGQLVFNIGFYDSTTDRYNKFSVPYYGGEDTTGTAFLTPSGLRFSGLFEVVAMDSDNMVAILKQPIEVGGIEIKATNRGSGVGHHFRAMMVYSYRGEK